MRVNHLVADLLAELREAASPPPVVEAEEDETEPCDEAADDPYCVTVPRFTYCSRQEYNDSCRVALEPAVGFDFDRFAQVSRHAYPKQAVADPQQFYAHDPILLVDAVAMACHGEAVARRVATQVTYDNLVLVENGDVARVLDTLLASETMCATVKSAAEQYLFALMAVDHATRHLPDTIKDKLIY